MDRQYRRQRPATPAQLAQRLIPGYVVTPAIKLLSDELVRAVEEPYLRSAHGPDFDAYVARTGRFLPAVGRGGSA